MNIRLIARRQPLVQAEKLEGVEFVVVGLGQVGAVLGQHGQRVYVAIEAGAVGGREAVLARFQVQLGLLELEEPLADFGAPARGRHVQQVSPVLVGYLVAAPALLNGAEENVNVAGLGHEGVELADVLVGATLGRASPRLNVLGHVRSI